MGSPMGLIIKHWSPTLVLLLNSFMYNNHRSKRWCKYELWLYEATLADCEVDSTGKVALCVTKVGPYPTLIPYWLSKSSKGKSLSNDSTTWPCYIFLGSNSTQNALSKLLYSTSHPNLWVQFRILFNGYFIYTLDYSALKILRYPPCRVNYS